MNKYLSNLNGKDTFVLILQIEKPMLSWTKNVKGRLLLNDVKHLSTSDQSSALKLSTILYAALQQSLSITSILRWQPGNYQLPCN